MAADLIIGDVFEALADIPADSIDTVITSPPFLGLRSYLPPNHPDKGKEIGSELTPGAFLDTLIDVVEMCAVVLAPHGSIVFELGDTYSGSGGAGGDYDEDGLRAGQPAYKGSAARKENRVVLADGRTIQSAGISNGQVRGGDGWPLDKSLCAIPALFEIALSYGFNPLTGRKTDRWRVRNEVVWCRPNPAVGALGDKYRSATSYLAVACKARDRWFDLDSVRGQYAPRHGGLEGVIDPRDTERAKVGLSSGKAGHGNNPAGAPPLDYWVIPPQGFPGAHYATFCEALVVKPILSMCPERVCTTCGKPSRRIVENESVRERGESQRTTRYDNESNYGGSEPVGGTVATDRTTLGWTDCGCCGSPELTKVSGGCGKGHWRAGRVLDPFAGAGTTGLVATRLGRDALLIDLDERNEKLIRDRLGLFMGGVTYIGRDPVPSTLSS